MIKSLIVKEVKVFFRSPISFLILGIFALISGWLFFNLLTYFVENVQRLPLDMRTPHDFSNHVIIKLFGNLNFLLILIVPLLTMGSFSEEYRSGTIELYYTSKMSDSNLVLGKVLSSFIRGLPMIALTFVFPVVLMNLNLNDSYFIFTAYMGLILNLLCYSAIGVFTSALSSNQILSAISSIVIMLFLWMFPMLGEMTSNYVLVKMVDFLSLSKHYQSFIRGWISFSDISFYLSLSFLFLYLTTKRIGMRSW